jgi:hypothetical protein
MRQLLCTGKDHALVEYALSGMNQPLFVSKYQLELPSKDALQQFIDQKRKEVTGEIRCFPRRQRRSFLLPNGRNRVGIWIMACCVV